MAKQEVTRTPDRLRGAENMASAVARVLDFTLQNQMQKQREMQALDKVREMQAAEDARLDEKIRADFANLQTKLADEGLRWKEQKAIEQQKLDQMKAKDDQAAEIGHLKRLQELRDAQNKLKIERMQRDIEESQSNRDINFINAAKSLYPVESYLNTYETLIKVPYETGIDPMPYLEQAENLRRQRRAFLQAQGVNIPEEAGPFREGYRFPFDPFKQQQTGQQSPFDFMGEGGRELIQPNQQAPTKEKTKLEWPE